MAADAFSVSGEVVNRAGAGACVEVCVGFAGQAAVRERGCAGVANSETDDLLAVSVLVSLEARVAGADTIEQRCVRLAHHAVVVVGCAAGQA